MPKYEVTIREIRFATEIVEADEEWLAEDKILKVPETLIEWDDDEREIVSIEEIEEEDEEEEESKAEVEEK